MQYGGSSLQSQALNQTVAQRQRQDTAQPMQPRLSYWQRQAMQPQFGQQASQQFTALQPGQFNRPAM